MKNTSPQPENFFKTACCFESFLIILAIFLGWMADINPFESLTFSETAIFYGLSATFPLFLLFLVMEHMPIPSIQKIRALLLETIAPCLHKYHWSDLLTLAVIAGFSEEVLFRGVIQPWMENSWSMPIGLIGSSILFGLVHAITPLYAFLAMSISIYLGLFLDYGGERNLLIPIVIHSSYDFLAFLAITKTYRAKLANDPTTE